jgi:hypothetical protein
MSALSQTNDLGLEKVVSWTVQHDEVSNLFGLGERALVERIYCYALYYCADDRRVRRTLFEARGLVHLSGRLCDGEMAAAPLRANDSALTRWPPRPSA